ncbi:FAD-dependent oxidoreductase [Nocardia sp. CA-084685]|uniref:FAD-dependent oxidoreductase n=1 Tax=Nocardia sp. CA-084685 TaxID=3239970 RepID=UPI003D9672C3
MSELWQTSTDVLVIGGGPAAAWAAIHAREAGAEVTLVDKGYCGTSGATAPSGTGVWYVAPEETARVNAKASREALGGHLADHYWMDRVLDQTYTNMNRLAVEGKYPFPTDPATGEQLRTGVQGPEYMRRMRAWVKRVGVRILDHSPALELLVDDAGTVRGAAGYQRQLDRDYRIAAGAVVLASGGCAFLASAVASPVAAATIRHGRCRRVVGPVRVRHGSRSARLDLTPVVRGAGRTGLRPSDSPTLDAAEVVEAAQAELIPFQKNYLRHGERLRPALDALDTLWERASNELGGRTGDDRIRARQAAAITAVGRLMYESSLARTETRGMSKRADHPEQDPAQRHHILSGGLDAVWTETAEVAS